MSFLAARVAFLSVLVVAQFEVASVRPSQTTVGPDYNNQISVTPTGFTARNATLRRLIADAWQIQINQVIGPDWLDHSEYDITARIAEGTSRQQVAPMLKTLLEERFHLKEHNETRNMRVYELEVGKSGAKIKPIREGESGQAAPGMHFHGEMPQFADLLALQFSMPPPQDPSAPVRASGPPPLVVDKTGLQGTYDFSVDVHPELGGDNFAVWKRALEDQLGLTVDSRKGDVSVVVVDSADKIPGEN
jgi:uncharacterized protein (TIGR03435 family)